MAGSGRGRRPLGDDFLPSADPHPGTSVPRLLVRALSTEVFLANFSHRSPVILSGVVSRWPATSHWSWRSLTEEKGRYGAYGKLLAQYLPQYFTAPRGDPGLWKNETLFSSGLITQKPFSLDCPFDQVTDQAGGKLGLLGGNFLPRLCSSWVSARKKAEDAGLLPAQEDSATDCPSPHTYLIAGPAGSGGTLHTDPEATAYWNAVVHGRKRWMFIRPEELHMLASAVVLNPELSAQVTSLVEGSSATQKVTSARAMRSILRRIPAIRWFGSLVPLLAQNGIAFEHLDAIVEAGELIYGPPHLLHIVLALEDSIGCSEQLVDEGNLADWVRDPHATYAPDDVHLGCSAASMNWPELVKPFEKRCSAAARELRHLSGASTPKRAKKKREVAVPEGEAQAQREQAHHSRDEL